MTNYCHFGNSLKNGHCPQLFGIFWQLGDIFLISLENNLFISFKHLILSYDICKSTQPSGLILLLSNQRVCRFIAVIMKRVKGWKSIIATRTTLSFFVSERKIRGMMAWQKTFTLKGMFLNLLAEISNINRVWIIKQIFVFSCPAELTQ